MNPRLVKLHEEAQALGQQAVATWGRETQASMVLEEAGELLVALLHWGRGRANWRDVLEEMVDVEVTLHGLRAVLSGMDHGLVDIEAAEAALLQTKLARLRDRIASGKGHEGVEAKPHG